MEITVLCKVVDNYGDIGVVWRLCRRLKTLNENLKLNLIVDDLISFNKICSDVTEKDFQIIQNIEIYKWQAGIFCFNTFLKNDGEKLQFILECFQCGRPDWMEKILFEQKLNRTVQIIMIDYLTAEKYAEDFHCLQSLTRSAKVQKVNFMPGFTPKTGGLIIDDPWAELQPYNANGPILIFTYERDWNPLAKALKHAAKVQNIAVAQGRGFESFVSAWNDTEDTSIKLTKLDYLNQKDWDCYMKNCSTLIIRGEESMSRACLSGIPFIWHAYPQSDEYQLVKVNALLDRMKQHFADEDFEIIRKVWILFNSSENEVSKEDLETACIDFLQKVPVLISGYRDFARSLRENGDLGVQLINYMEKIKLPC